MNYAINQRAMFLLNPHGELKPPGRGVLPRGPSPSKPSWGTETGMAKCLNTRTICTSKPSWGTETLEDPLALRSSPILLSPHGELKRI